MKRINNKSLKNLIINEKDYKFLHPEYLKILQKLINDNNIIDDESYSKLVNFKKNKNYAKHNWFDYKHGFSEDLVKKIISSSKINYNDIILDPFCGVGTTNLVSQSLGIRSFGYDINPIALLAARVKTSYYSENDIKKIIFYLKIIKNKTISFSPKSNLIKSSYNQKVLTSLDEIYQNIFKIKNTKQKEFLMLGYLSIIETLSNRKKDGNGIKIAYKTPKFFDAHKEYEFRIKKMINELKLNNFKSESKIIDANFMNADIENIRNKVGLTIFSPPYANCFDYFEVYKLEMWMGRFVKDYKDFNKYRSKALRSHVNSSFNHSIINFNQDVEIIAKLLSCYNLWNKNIPDMIRGYFDDMTVTLKKIFDVSKTGSLVHIIVANSGYKGILVPTDLLLSNIGKKIGFKIKKIIYARKIRSSSQQMKLIEKKYEKLMRESIIILQKN